MWRKTYSTMYDGSLVGAGAMVFAVMNYIITKQEYDRGSGEWRVRLNPRLLGMVIGEVEGEVERAIQFLSKEDEDSTGKREGGRRIVAVAEGAMEYRVVNGDVYQDRRDHEMRKEQNRVAQAKFRAIRKGRSIGGAGERQAEAEARGEGVGMG